MSDHLQIRSYVARILRLKEEAKDINRDIREVYAEAKGNGFDKTVLGKLVSYIEKREADSNAQAESEALFDLYLSAYDGARPSHAYAYAREGNDSDGRKLSVSTPTDRGIDPRRMSDGVSQASDNNGLAGPALAEDAQPANTKPAAISSPVNDSGQGEADGAFRPGNRHSVPSAANSHGQPRELAE